MKVGQVGSPASEVYPIGGRGSLEPAACSAYELSQRPRSSLKCAAPVGGTGIPCQDLETAQHGGQQSHADVHAVLSLAEVGSPGV